MCLETRRSRGKPCGLFGTVRMPRKTCTVQEAPAIPPTNRASAAPANGSSGRAAKARSVNPLSGAQLRADQPPAGGALRARCPRRQRPVRPASSLCPGGIARAGEMPGQALRDGINGLDQALFVLQLAGNATGHLRTSPCHSCAGTCRARPRSATISMACSGISR